MITSVDCPSLVLDGQFTRRTRTLTVLQLAGTAPWLHSVMETLYSGSTAVRCRFDLKIIELDGAGGAQCTNLLAVNNWEVDHPSGAPALAVRARLADTTFAYAVCR